LNFFRGGQTLDNNTLLTTADTLQTNVQGCHSEWTAQMGRLSIAKNKLAHTPLDSEWRGRAGFNSHADLIPAANLIMQ